MSLTQANISVLPTDDHSAETYIERLKHAKGQYHDNERFVHER